METPWIQGVSMTHVQTQQVWNYSCAVVIQCPDRHVELTGSAGNKPRGCFVLQVGIRADTGSDNIA